MNCNLRVSVPDLIQDLRIQTGQLGIKMLRIHNTGNKDSFTACFVCTKSNNRSVGHPSAFQASGPPHSSIRQPDNSNLVHYKVQAAFFVPCTVPVNFVKPEPGFFARILIKLPRVKTKNVELRVEAEGISKVRSRSRPIKDRRRNSQQ